MIQPPVHNKAHLELTLDRNMRLKLMRWMLCAPVHKTYMCHHCGLTTDDQWRGDSEHANRLVQWYVNIRHDISEWDCHAP